MKITFTKINLCLWTLQFLLVDLRCHGESASLRKRGPHSVVSAARDVLQLVCATNCAWYSLAIVFRKAFPHITTMLLILHLIALSILGMILLDPEFQCFHGVFISDGAIEAHSSCFNRT